MHLCSATASRTDNCKDVRSINLLDTYYENLFGKVFDDRKNSLCSAIMVIIALSYCLLIL